MHVKFAYRRRGVARRCLQRLIDECASAAHEQVRDRDACERRVAVAQNTTIPLVLTTEKLRALRLYRSMGEAPICEKLKQ